MIFAEIPDAIPPLQLPKQLIEEAKASFYPLILTPGSSNPMESFQVVRDRLHHMLRIHLTQSFQLRTPRAKPPLQTPKGPFHHPTLTTDLAILCGLDSIDRTVTTALVHDT